MLIIIGIYFTHNFTGACFLIFDHLLTSPCSHWWVKGSTRSAILHTRQTHRSGSMGLKTSTYVCRLQIRSMCTRECCPHSSREACSLCAPQTFLSQFLVCVVHERTGRNLKHAGRFPAMAYGTLVAGLAGWKAVQRYRSIRGSTTSPNGGWLLNIFIRQAISA